MKVASRDDVVDVPGTAAVYQIRVPTKRDKIAILQRTREAGGRRFDDAVILSRVGVVLDRIIKESPAEYRPDYERQLATVKRFAEERARMEKLVGDAVRALLRRVRLGADAGGTVEDAIKPHLEELSAFRPLAEDYAQIERIVEELDDGVRQMRAANEVFWQWYNLTAAEVLLAGWEPRTDYKGKKLPAFARVGGRLAKGLLDRVPDEDIGAIGNAALAAMSPSEDEAKNSESPSGTPSPGGDSGTGSSTGLPTTPLPSTTTVDPPAAS